MKDLIDTVLEQRRNKMMNNNSLVTKRWHSYKFRIDGTLIVVDVKAEDRKAAYKIMQDNYPDVNFTDVEVNE